MLSAFIIFIITYLFIGLRQIPRIHIDRPAGALVGAVLMVVFGVLTLDQAFAAIDMHTLLLLLGMMIVTSYLRAAGFFELMADRILSLSKTPLQLLIFIMVSSGVLSALFVNDTICLLYTPIVLELTIHLGVNPMPYLLGLAMSSNIGSVMTVTGNPQNMLIGIHSKIPYLAFLGALFPVALLGIIVSIIAIRVIYSQDMKKSRFLERPTIPPYTINRPLLIKSLLACASILVAFSIGYPYSLAAAGGAVMLMLIGGVRTERVLEGVDWTLLLFFSGLFVVMHGVEVSGLASAIIDRTGNVGAYSAVGKITGISLASAVLSNVVSNVPAVMLLKPLIVSIGGERIAWLALAMSSTLAGNFTLIGSVANLIVAQQARKKVEIGFVEYFRVGALVTAITIATGILVLAFEVEVVQGAEALAGEQQERQMTVTVTPRGYSAGRRTFTVVLLCDTDQSRAKGLQGFRPLLPREAALFVFREPEAVTFWMGTVTYPIDIIFVGPDGHVIEVAQRCLPGSHEFYGSGVPVKWVVETAEGSGIMIGDRVKIEGFGAHGHRGTNRSGTGEIE
ncbi:MAG TPA: SLC13 family permease [Nitrospirota bacterium]|nr:SLC13 family permease [Nitrospirota bacterium]